MKKEMLATSKTHAVVEGPLPTSDRHASSAVKNNPFPNLLCFTRFEFADALRVSVRTVDRMIAAGALDELCVVRTAGPLSRTLQQAIGVRELSACLDGTLSVAEATAQIKQRTRRLVQRQLTWMRKLPDAATIAVTADSPGAVADRLARLLGT